MRLPVNPLDEPALIDEGGLLRGVVVCQAHFHLKTNPWCLRFVYQENGGTEGKAQVTCTPVWCVRSSACAMAPPAQLGGSTSRLPDGDGVVRSACGPARWCGAWSWTCASMKSGNAELNEPAPRRRRGGGVGGGTEGKAQVTWRRGGTGGGSEDEAQATCTSARCTRSSACARL